MAIRMVPLDDALLQLLRPREPILAEQLREPAYRRGLVRPGWALAALEGGLVVGAGGLVPVWPGRALAWMGVGEQSEWRHLLIAARRLRPWLDGMIRLHALRRIECTVLDGFEAGFRWAHLLGFEAEGLMRCFAPDGQDHRLFARVTPEAMPMVRYPRLEDAA